MSASAFGDRRGGCDTGFLRKTGKSVEFAEKTDDRLSFSPASAEGGRDPGQSAGDRKAQLFKQRGLYLFGGKFGEREFRRVPDGIARRVKIVRVLFDPAKTFLFFHINVSLRFFFIFIVMGEKEFYNPHFVLFSHAK